MPARAMQVHLLEEEARRTGLTFATPSWWDLAFLFERYADRCVHLAAGSEALLVPWFALLSVERDTGRKIWAPPWGASREAGREHEKGSLPLVQEVKWFVITREEVWMVPEASRPGCWVLPSPVWWDAQGDKAFDAWRTAFYLRYQGRFLEEKIPFDVWDDRVALFTAQEIRPLDERGRRAYLHALQKRRRPLQRKEKAHMERVARALAQAVWVVLYWYEWESGLE